MSQQEISRRYAKALLVTAHEKNNKEQVLTELKVLSEVFADKEIHDFLSSPLVSHEQKVALLKKTLSDRKISEEVMNLTEVLINKSRQSIFTTLMSSFQFLVDQENGITRGTVRAAKPLSAELQKDLESKITQTLKKKIVLTFKEDPSIIGGVVAEVGGWTFDDSTETHLKRLNEDLMKI